MARREHGESRIHSWRRLAFLSVPRLDRRPDTPARGGGGRVRAQVVRSDGGPARPSCYTMRRSRRGAPRRAPPPARLVKERGRRGRRRFAPGPRRDAPRAPQRVVERVDQRRRRRQGTSRGPGRRTVSRPRRSKPAFLLVKPVLEAPHPPVGASHRYFWLNAEEFFSATRTFLKNPRPTMMRPRVRVWAATLSTKRAPSTRAQPAPSSLQPSSPPPLPDATTCGRACGNATQPQLSAVAPQPRARANRARAACSPAGRWTRACRRPSLNARAQALPVGGLHRA